MGNLKGGESKIVLFSGARGGCGCSFIAGCVSAYLAMKTNKNVVLLDLGIGKKDSRIIFGVSNENCRDWGDIEEIIDDLDNQVLRRLIINFESSLNLILPSLRMEKNKIFSFGNLEKLLDGLRESFDIILVDFPCYLFTFYKLDYREYGDRLVMVSSPDLISINNINILIDNIGLDEFSTSLSIVINRYNLRYSIPPSRLNYLLKYPVEAFVPYDRDVEFLFLNKGPFSIFNYSLRIVKILAELSERMFGELGF